MKKAIGFPNLDRRKTLKTALFSTLYPLLSLNLHGKKSTALALDIITEEDIAVFEKKRDQILQELFDTTLAAEDASIIIDTPVEAEHSDYVPFQITVNGAEKIAVFVEPTPDPLAMVFTMHPRSGHTVRGTLDMTKGSTLSCYAFKNKQLVKAARYVRPGISGYNS